MEFREWKDDDGSTFSVVYTGEELNTAMDIEYDPVNHPSHYTSGKYECIEVMEDALGTEAVKHFCLGNAFKYIFRSGRKNTTPLEDIKKANWYLNKYIELEEANGIRKSE